MFRRPLGSSTRRAFSAALSSRSTSTTSTSLSAHAHSNHAHIRSTTTRPAGMHCSATGDLVVTFVVANEAMGTQEAATHPLTLFRPSRPLLAPAKRGGGGGGGSSNTDSSSIHADEKDEAASGSAGKHGATTPFTASTASAEAASPSPFDITVESVLLPASSYAGASQSLRGLVALLLDPNPTGVEDVSLSDFVAMMPKRQLAALGHNREWHEVVLGAEQFQAAKDARALRLAGVVSLGRWDEVPDRVPISAYSRGLLSHAYHDAMRTRGQRQKEEVLTWLTQAIQRAVAEEFAVATGGQGKKRAASLPLLSAGTPAPAPASAADGYAGITTTTTAAAAAAAAGAPGERGQQRPARAAASALPVEEEASGSGDGAATDAAREDAEYARMITELESAETDMQAEGTDADSEIVAAAAAAEEGKKRKGGKRGLPAAAWFDRSHKGPQAAAAPAATPISAEEVEVEGDVATAAKASGGDAAQDGEVEEIVEEIVEEVEEVEEEGHETANEEAPAHAENAAAPAAAEASAPSHALVEPKLLRLAQLMLTQFNSADGFLHSTNKKELKADEKAGYVTVVDEETAQVDPLALFSAFHNAKIAADAPIEVRALKQVWNNFNAHQMLMEDASDPMNERFHRQKSIDALVHGALMMRAISREEDVMLDHVSLLPSYGFPVLSTDMRSYAAEKPPDSPHTDISFMTVDVAVNAFKKFFANAEVRNTPFRPRVDVNCGCGVVMLSGTTLHLYDTSLKSRIQEDQVRANFAEAMLGVLHLCKNTVLPRVNTVHYHIMITSLPSSSGEGGGLEGEEDADRAIMRNEITSPTTIVSIDMTGPFTAAEKVRLRALSEPLGFTADEMSEFNCIEDIVMAIDDARGVTVVHDLLQNRDDLEALLTPTLVELLPDDVDDGLDGDEEEGSAAPAAEEEEVVEEVEEEDEEEAPVPVKSRPLPTNIPKKQQQQQQPSAATASTSAGGKHTRRAAVPVEEEVEEEYEYVEDEEEAVPPPPPPPAKKKAVSAPPKKSVKGAKDAGRSTTTTAAAEEEEGEEAEEDPQQRQRQRRHKEEAAALAYELAAEDAEDATVVTLRPASARKRAAPARTAALAEADAWEDGAGEARGEEEAEPPARANTSPRPAAAAAAAPAAVKGRRGAAPPPPSREWEELEEEEELYEEEEEEEVSTPPAPSRRQQVPPPAARRATTAAPPRRAPPAQAAQEAYEYEEEEEEEENGAVEATRPRAPSPVKATRPPVHGAKKARAPPPPPPSPSAKSKQARGAAVEPEGEGNEEDRYGAAKARPKRRYFS